MTSTTTTTSVQPDIDYHPDIEKYRQRTVLRLKADPTLPNTPLPAGFPPEVEHPSVWEGKDWTNEEQWVYKLSEEELEEIDDALKHFECKPLLSTKFIFVFISSFSVKEAIGIYLPRDVPSPEFEQEAMGAGWRFAYGMWIFCAPYHTHRPVFEGGISNCLCWYVVTIG